MILRKSEILTRFFNGLSRRIGRKVVVFQSDDWGMVRMSSKRAFDYFEKKGYAVSQCIYNTNDCLEENDDLELLLEVLDAFSDCNGNRPVITLNTVVANPKFDNIRDHNYERYFCEPFFETYERSSKSDRVMTLLNEGIARGLLSPQFHGREHLNVINWMEALSSRSGVAREAFNWGMYSVHARGGFTSCKMEFLDAFGNPGQVAEYKKIIAEGLSIFGRAFGYAATSFIAPCFYWPSALNKYLKSAGILSLQGSRVQKEPLSRKRVRYLRKYHYTGQRNSHGQMYLVRNASFEVSENPDKDWVASCLKDIDLAFRSGRPAIISAHRVCFMGGLRRSNRDRTLTLLSQLIDKILHKWPDCEFLSTQALECELARATE